MANAVVDSISIGEPPEFRDHVVRGSDFFAADEHPRISFRSTAIDSPMTGRRRSYGVLEIRGVERACPRGRHVCARRLRIRSETPGSGSRLEAVIDRRNWDMDWQMPLPAGGDALGWEVEITAQLEFTKRR